MAINKNHEFEELDGIKCAIVERAVTAERLSFLKNLLEYNHYTVVVVPVEDKFTVGVTDLMFNPVNAIFGRLLKSPRGHVVTLAYWRQEDSGAKDEIPYFARNVNCD